MVAYELLTSQEPIRNYTGPRAVASLDTRLVETRMTHPSRMHGCNGA
jgi:hypothetical protein